VHYKGLSYKLGLKTYFISRPRTQDEIIELLRRQYAFGGFFAANKTYREVLLAKNNHPNTTPAYKAAIATELSQPSLPSTQEEMSVRLGKQSKTPLAPRITQPALPGF
jgi:hypothetical protein